MAGQMFVAGNAYLDNADAKEPDGYPAGEFIRSILLLSDDQRCRGIRRLSKENWPTLCTNFASSDTGSLKPIHPKNDSVWLLVTARTAKCYTFDTIR
jgi:hypothetical protein